MDSNEEEPISSDDEPEPPTLAQAHLLKTGLTPRTVVSYPQEIGLAGAVTEDQYLRRVQRRGVEKWHKRRKRRLERKELLERVGRHKEAANFALQSSSSEESSEDERVDIPPIDWTQAEWGRHESLFGHMPILDMSSLVGWATFLKSDKNEHPQNPLLDFPNTPLSPSMLEYIKQHAIVDRKSAARHEWKTMSFLAREETPARTRKTPHWIKSRSKRTAMQRDYWDYNSDDENYQWMKEHFKPTKVVEMTVPVPSVGKKKRKHERIPLDISGQVALGMVVEEVLTASFIPLARQHVEKCRQKDDAFHEWTLPPEEAILSSHISAPLPSTTPTEGQPDRELVTNWCKSRGLDPAFVEDNMDIYGKILPCAPVAQINDAGSLRNRLVKRLKRAKASESM